MTPSLTHLPLRGVMAGFRRITVPEYHQLAQLGILTENDDLELIEGYLVHKMTRNAPHDGTLDDLVDLIFPLVTKDWKVRIQEAVTLSDSEPEPDLAVVRRHAVKYKQRHPGPADIGLIIEVADSTLDSDRADKCRIYARAGIPVYWIVNVADEQIEVYTSPVGDPAPEYRVRTDRRSGDDIDVILDGRRVGSVSVAAVFA